MLERGHFEGLNKPLTQREIVSFGHIFHYQACAFYPTCVYGLLG